MRLRAVGALLCLSSAAIADDTVFDFVAPRADQQGAYAPGPRALVAGGVGTLTPVSGWIDEDWAYRRPIWIVNGGDTALMEWPLALTIDGAEPAGADVFADADPLGSDLRVIVGGAPLTKVSRGVWNAAENHGVLWLQAPLLPVGTTTYDLYYGNTDAALADDPAAVFTFSAPVATRYLLHPAGPAATLASTVATNAWTLSASSGTLMPGEVTTAPGWVPGQAVASTGPIEVLVDVDAGTEAAPIAFASARHEVVINRGTPSRFTFASPLADTTVTVSIAGAPVASVPVAAASYGEWVGTVPANSIVTLTATAPIVATYRGDDNLDGFVLAPAATEVWGVRSGTPRIHALDGAATVTVHDSSGATATVTVPANGAATLAAGGSGTGEALRLVATAPITVVSNGDGDGGEAITFHPVSELGRDWVVPTAGRFVIIATTGVGTTCTLTPPAGAPTTASASVTITPPAPGRVMFGATTGSNIAAGSLVSCDAPGFAYYEDAATDDERNLFPMEAHRKRALVEPTVTLGDPAATRYGVGFVEVIETPELVAPTGVVEWSDFRVATLEPAGSEITYQISIDGGATWIVAGGGTWGGAPPTIGAPAGDLGAAMPALPTDTGRLRVRALLRSVDGITRPTIDAIRVFYQPAGDADRLRWDPVPESVTSGTAFPARLTAIDSLGTVLTGISGEVTLTASHGGVVEPATVTLDAGAADFAVVVHGAADDVTITAHGPGGLVGTTLPFDVLAPAGSTLEIAAGDGQFGATGTLTAEPLTVLALDAAGAPLAGVQVTFTVVEGGGTVTSAVATTDADGLAGTRLRLGPPGPQRVRADAVGASVTFVARADEPGATPPEDSGCGCRVSGAAPSAPAALLLLLFLARRRRS